MGQRKFLTSLCSTVIQLVLLYLWQIQNYPLPLSYSKIILPLVSWQMNIWNYHMKLLPACQPFCLGSQEIFFYMSIGMIELFEDYHFLFWTSKIALRVKNLPANAGDTRDAYSSPGSGRSSEVGNGTPLQYSCLENFHGRSSLAGYTAHRAARSWTWLSTVAHLLFYQNRKPDSSDKTDKSKVYTGEKGWKLLEWLKVALRVSNSHYI